MKYFNRDGEVFVAVAEGGRLNGPGRNFYGAMWLGDGRIHRRAFDKELAATECVEISREVAIAMDAKIVAFADSLSVEDFAQYEVVAT